jgi:hypothetical protein
MMDTPVALVAVRLKALPLRHRMAHLRALVGLQPQDCRRREQLVELLREETSRASGE